MGDEAGVILSFIQSVIHKVRRFFLPRFEVYTDGSVKNGRGSWAYVIVRRDRVLREASGTHLRPTSNQMEFQAAIEALSSLPENSRIELYTDSRVLIETLQKVPEWKVLGWVKSRGQPIPQVSQLKQLDQLLAVRDVQLKWVKAHSGIKHNERCDVLCIQARSGS
ncbi:ribonuclease H family protein [Bdellovibrio bacteriovorus]|uniref:ribonuclease H family protein n=1 Tax=Bdellovibrio bacteriovorus TaxID=959 RepID=UPI003AA83FB2